MHGGSEPQGLTSHTFNLVVFISKYDQDAGDLGKVACMMITKGIL